MVFFLPARVFLPTRIKTAQGLTLVDPKKIIEGVTKHQAGKIA